MFADEQGLIKGDLARELAREFGVEASVFERDYLLNAVVWAFKGDVAAGYRHYIADGRANAEQIREVIQLYCGDRLAQKKADAGSFAMLDFACGYGRVGRHIKNVLPEVDYVGADVHHDAVKFNRDVLGLRVLRSTPRAEDFYLGETFDFIFALSFFSHLRREHFLGWLSELHGLLKTGGVLMISTQGRTTHKSLLPDVVVEPDGYGMIATSEQFDLSTNFYIHAITYQNFVETAAAAVRGLELLNFSEGFWFGHQDMYVMRNVAPAQLGGERRLRRLRYRLSVARDSAAYRLRRLIKLVT